MDPMKSLQKRSLSESSNEWLPLKKRRESQASTTTASNSEELDHDAIQRLNQALESNSDSEGPHRPSCECIVSSLCGNTC